MMGEQSTSKSRGKRVRECERMADEESGANRVAAARAGE